MATDIKYGNFSFQANNLSIPTISINTNLATTDAGALLGNTLNISLNGRIIATGDKPLNDNTNYSRSQLQTLNIDTSWNTLIQQIKIIESGFSSDYEELKIQCNNNDIWNFHSNNINPKSSRVNRIEFSNGSDNNWSQVIDYTIDLEVDTTGAIGYIPKLAREPYYVSTIENNYTITPLTDNNYYMSDPTSVGANFSNSFSGTYFPYATGDRYPGYTITRRLGATGRATKPNTSNPRSTALQNAKSFVTGLLFYDNSIYTILNNLTIYDRSTVIDASDIDGRYGITDTFTAYSGRPPQPFSEVFNIQNSVDNNFARTVTIQGSIQGLKTVDTTNSGLYWDIFNADNTNMKSKYLFPTYTSDSLAAYRAASGFLDQFMVQKIPYHRCVSSIFPSGGFINTYRLSLENSTQPLFRNLSGWLNPTPINVNIDHKIPEGAIDYTFTFDSRPLNLIPGAFNESLDVKDDFATRQYASQVVFGRMPLLQDLGTYSLPSRTVTYSATFIPQGSFSYLNIDIINKINDIIEEFNPNKLNPASVPLALRGRYYYYSWIRDQTENFDPLRGSFTKNLTWNYELRYWHRTRL
jgi:hypothetical protein